MAVAAGGPLSREQYEAEAEKFGFLARLDRDCVTSGDYGMPYAARAAAEGLLSQRRGAGREQERPVRRPAPGDDPGPPRCRRCGGVSPQTTVGGGVCDDCAA